MKDFPHFIGEKEITIKTLSPIVAYQSKDKYFTYYKPSDSQFITLVKDNIIHKTKAYNYPLNSIYFDILDIKYQKEKMVYFKNTFYKAYQTEMKIKVNYDTFKIIYDTGLSSKGSCGFGMIEYKYEKDFLSL
jgi:CRISPR-associated endoribonuclease Cas6